MPISPPPKPEQPLALLSMLIIVLLGIGFYLHAGLDTRELNVPVIRGRSVLDRLYGAMFGGFWIYAGFRFLRRDVAPGWARNAADQDALWARFIKRPVPSVPLAERVQMYGRMAIAFSTMAFGIGVLSLAYEAWTLFFG